MTLTGTRVKLQPHEHLVNEGPDGTVRPGVRLVEAVLEQELVRLYAHRAVSLFT